MDKLNKMPKIADQPNSNAVGYGNTNGDNDKNEVIN